VQLKLAVVIPLARVDSAGAGVDLLLGRTLDLVSFETTLAFELVVSVAEGVLLELEKLAQVLERKVPFDVLFLVDDTRRQRLFVRLPVKATRLS
jgi:hypothetical protein